MAFGVLLGPLANGVLAVKLVEVDNRTEHNIEHVPTRQNQREAMFVKAQNITQRLDSVMNKTVLVSLCVILKILTILNQSSASTHKNPKYIKPKN